MNINFNDCQKCKKIKDILYDVSDYTCCNNCVKFKHIFAHAHNDITSGFYSNLSDIRELSSDYNNYDINHKNTNLTYKEYILLIFILFIIFAIYFKVHIC